MSPDQPIAPGATAAAAEPRGIPRPAVAPPAPWDFPRGERTRLPNGLTLVTYHVPGQYVVSVRTAIPLPTSREPRDREGVATVMARLLDEGTQQHSAEEFAELLERKGIALGAGMTESGLSVDLDVPARRLPEALDLLRQALAEPVFPEAEVRRHVRTRLAEIEQERAVPAQRAAKEFIATFHDPGERVSRPTAGTRETVAPITRADIVDFHRRHVGPLGGTVAIAGDLTGLDVPALVDQTLGGWRGGPVELVARPTTAARRAADAGRIVFVDRPGSVQSEFAIGLAGPDRRVEGGWAPYPVLAYVLGGSPSARIDAVLREEKGFTYGIRSAFRPRRVGGLFLTSGSVRADSTAESLSLLLDILDGAREGFTEEELTSGVDFLAKTAPGRYATADAIADEAAGLALDDLTTEFTTENLRRMQALSADDLARAWRQVATGEWTVVVVGDAEAHADAVRALGRGEVAVVPA